MLAVHELGEARGLHGLKEHLGGRVHRAALEATVAITVADTSRVGVQWQCPKRYVKNKPLKCFANGSRDLVGVFGHRDVTTERGYHDPGDVIFDLLEARGFERFDFRAGEDLDVWAKRQEWLRSLGVYIGAIDGIAASETTRALRELGYADGIFVHWRDLAERPPDASKVAGCGYPKYLTIVAMRLCPPCNAQDCRCWFSRRSF